MKNKHHIVLHVFFLCELFLVVTPQILSRNPSESPDPEVGQHRQSMRSFQMILIFKPFQCFVWKHLASVSYLAIPLICV